MKTVGSLFSGIGGIELGLERTGGFKTIWHCEIDPYASAVLKKHWPDVPNLGDITKVNWNEVEKPDMLCGGFPCQDISVAGKGKGIEGGHRSGLWFEYAKAISHLRPRIALIENVPAIVGRGLDIVLADLAEMRYDAEWFSLSACAVGAPHTRERMFIVAYSCLDGCDIPFRSTSRFSYEGRETKEKMQERGNVWLDASKGSGWAVEPRMDRVANGLPNQMDRIKCLGNAVVPQVAEVIGEMILEELSKQGAK